MPSRPDGAVLSFGKSLNSKRSLEPFDPTCRNLVHTFSSSRYRKRATPPPYRWAMAETKRLGQLAEMMVMTEAVRRHYRVLLPYGEDAPYDLVLERDGLLARVQVKYVRSDGRVIQVRCRSTNNWATHKYSSQEIDAIATYDHTTDAIYLVRSHEFADGMSVLHLRLAPSRNNQVSGVRWASDFLDW